MATINIDVDRYFSGDEDYLDELFENKDFQKIIKDWNRTLLSSFYLDVVSKYGAKHGRTLKKLLLDFEESTELEATYNFADFFVGKLAESGFKFRPLPFSDPLGRENED